MCLCIQIHVIITHLIHALFTGQTPTLLQKQHARKLTWTRRRSCLFALSGPRSAAATPAASPPGKHSLQPAQKQRRECADH